MSQETEQQLEQKALFWERQCKAQGVDMMGLRKDIFDLCVFVRPHVSGEVLDKVNKLWEKYHRVWPE